jgi:hypothetical protein
MRVSAAMPYEPRADGARADAKFRVLVYNVSFIIV